MTEGERSILVAVLTFHTRVDRPPYVGVCACGWQVLGASHAEHVADVYAQALERPELAG